MDRFRLTFHGITIEQYDDKGVLQPFATDLGYRWDNLTRDKVNFIEAIGHEARSKLLQAGLAHEDAMKHPVLPPLPLCPDKSRPKK